jgi:putative ABC transport system ATP-binding protein
MLKVNKLSKRFIHKHSKVTALDDVSFEIKDGEFLSITGPSGSGKSTLLLALGGMNSPEEGKVLWNNESIYDWKLDTRIEWRAKNIGFVFQTFNLIPYLNVFENVSIALSLSGKKEAGTKEVLNILERVKLSDRLDHLPNELSVGQQQRVALARALIKNPQLILADEPTGNLDSQTASEIINLLKEVNREGKTVVLITHDANLAKLGKRNIKLIEGKIS